MALDTALDTHFAGTVLRPGDAEYDEARSLFNGAIDKRPALIARCTGPDDVRAALAHAREHGLTVAVRGGGHSTAGHSSCDDGLVIDLSPMKHADIDLEARTGRFGGGMTWGDLDAATQQHGLAVTGGRVSHTGVGGLTLGSGSGWLERMLGPSCANLISAEVVTADGRILRASADEHADLFFGLRGGGGNFGVVTEFEFQLHRVGPLVYGGLVLHPRSAAPELIRFYREFMEQAPDDVGGGLALIAAPPAPFVPEEYHGQPSCGLVLVHAGDPHVGETALRPLLEWGDPWVRMTQPMPYVAVQQMLDEGNPWGIHEYFKVDYLEELPDDAIDAMLAMAGETRSPFTQIVLGNLGGAMDRIDREGMALGVPRAKWMYFCLAMWMDPALGDGEVAFARKLMETMRPWATEKAPANFISADEGEARLRASFGEEKYARLVAIKDAYDPDNVFALNQNIKPSGQTAPAG